MPTGRLLGIRLLFSLLSFSLTPRRLPLFKKQSCLKFQCEKEIYKNRLHRRDDTFNTQTLQSWRRRSFFRTPASHSEQDPGTMR
ncbi:Hypothetical predicted protein [Scomber scombrus]|uniref:Secreted protein n=1 Tax=Scomber scombrus TaxID=13677 RepID=A0AAV1Q534_SCOSC